eukprot:SAG11_NODE_874_length_6773_cov_4.639114_3_plen_79_part_00
MASARETKNIGGQDTVGDKVGAAVLVAARQQAEESIIGGGGDGGGDGGGNGGGGEHNTFDLEFSPQNLGPLDGQSQPD